MAVVLLRRMVVRQPAGPIDGGGGLAEEEGLDVEILFQVVEQMEMLGF